MTSITDILAMEPCPFCGDYEHLEVIHSVGTILKPHYFVRCDNCGARTGGTDNGEHVREWNARAPTQEAILGKKLAEALQQEYQDSLWNAYNVGIINSKGMWIDAGMSDAEHLAMTLGLDDGQHLPSIVQEKIKEAVHPLVSEWKKLEGVK